MRHRLLDDAPPHPHAAHQPPVAVDLPVLPANGVAQIHAASQPHSKPKKIPKVGTTRPNQPSALPKPLIRLTPIPVKSQKPPSTAQVGLARPPRKQNSKSDACCNIEGTAK